MTFKRDEVSQLLIDCHRRCCICYRFCGVKIETDHIRPKEDDGTDDIENAIPVCFDCHAEIHSYNVKHPRGRKFTPDELRGHRDSWLNICRQHPEMLLGSLQYQKRDVGPLQSLIDELEFNQAVASKRETNHLGCLFSDFQFNRAIDEGAISILQDELKSSLIQAYVAMGAANAVISSRVSPLDGRISRSGSASTDLDKRLSVCFDLIVVAHRELMKFLSRDDENG